MNQLQYYAAKLKFETDSWDLSEALNTTDSIVVIDVRSEKAYATEHIPSAINIPHGTLSQKTTEKLDKSKTYVVYCDGIGCNASTKGAINLAKLGFNVKELLGGLDWWKRDGHATKGHHGNAGGGTVCGC